MQGADLIVVHHGLIWGDGLRRIAGAGALRLKFLLEQGISLAAYHLPLDKHARLGNNVGLCDALVLAMPRGSFGDVRGVALGASGSWAAPISRTEALGRIAQGVCGGAEPSFVFPYGLIGNCFSASVIGTAVGTPYVAQVLENTNRVIPCRRTRSSRFRLLSRLLW